MKEFFGIHWQKTAVGGFILLLTGLLLAGRGSAQEQSAQTSAQKREQIESRRFSGHNQHTIPEKLSGTSGDLFVHAHLATIDIPGPANPPPYPPYQLVGMACASDAVVLGTAASHTSHLTADNTFLYSDWTFTVNQVLKNNAKASMSANSVITIARPGGQIETNGRKVYAIDDNFAAFHSGDQYLLFLQFIEQVGTYEAKAENVFRISGEKVGHLTQHAMTNLEDEGADTLIRETRDAIDAASTKPYCVGGAKKP